MSESKVSEIRVHEPCQRTVEALEQLLDDAKKGNVQGAVGVVIFDDGSTDQFWYDPPKVYHTTVLSDRIIGAMERCKHKLLRVRTDQEDDFYEPEGG